jgi:hypothetical protein
MIKIALVAPGSQHLASIKLIPKPNKNVTRKENYRAISLMKDSQQNTGKQNSTTHQKVHTQ